MNSFPTKGVDLSFPPESLSPEFANRAENLRFAFGVVKNRPGHSSISLPATPGTPRWIGRFYTSNSSVPHTICLTDTKAFRFSAGAWTQITPNAGDIPGGVFTGSTGQWSVTAGEGWLFWSKFDSAGVYGWSGTLGQDIYLLKDDTGGTFADGGSGTPKFVPPAQSVAYYNNRLFLIRPNEGSSDCRVRWAGNGTSTGATGTGDWNGTASGTGGFVDIFDPSDEPLVCGKVLRDRIILFKRHSLHELYKTGLGSLPHIVEIRIVGIGCRYQHSVQVIPQGILFGADENIYLWDGNSPGDVGTRVQPFYQQFSFAGAAMFSAVDSERQTYHLQLSGSQALVYDYIRDIWSTDYTPSGVYTAWGEGDLAAITYAWNTITGSWPAWPQAWQGIDKADNPQFFGGVSTPGTIYVLDGTTSDYNATPIAFALRLGEQTADGKQTNLHRVGVSHKPGAGQIGLSAMLDRGTNLVTDPPVAASVKGWLWFDFNQAADTIQLEFTGTGLVELRSYLINTDEGGQIF